MALMYDTTMSPSKLELLAAWLPTRPWFRGDASALSKVASYRLDDPEGEVGIEGHLVTAGDDTIYHAVLTYRGAAIADGEEFLVGTSAHGVLGTRWISDGAGDPVCRTVLAETMAHGRTEAEEFVHSDAGEPVPLRPRSQLRGSGQPDRPVPEMWAASVSELGGVTIADTGFATLRIRHVLDAAALAGGGAEALAVSDAEIGDGPDAYALRITWPGQEIPVTIATLTTVAPD
ncbi:maltokinase N-terminal cap-like domain-containing protein [Leucobacter luti]|uniref:Maltokinase N-terminal cap domain-containing protein n=1 Tax=Leucobacter luti TaxID=340320 RepID=A0A4Q7U4I5_9MICO|nr:hypothetical protein [Leucobacter luti]MBL3700589.1 hypothetical protein [Leucobacter luti]RZT68574.1 hypothetical protein EV139_0299 [Leucobacter luti]